jgi:hypothetical protein
LVVGSSLPEPFVNIVHGEGLGHNVIGEAYQGCLDRQSDFLVEIDGMPQVALGEVHGKEMQGEKAGGKLIDVARA